MTCDDGKMLETSRRELKQIGREMVQYGGKKLRPAEAYRCGREQLLVCWLAMRFEDAELA